MNLQNLVWVWGFWKKSGELGLDDPPPTPEAQREIKYAPVEKSDTQWTSENGPNMHSRLSINIQRKPVLVRFAMGSRKIFSSLCELNVLSFIWCLTVDSSFFFCFILYQQVAMARPERTKEERQASQLEKLSIPTKIDILYGEWCESSRSPPESVLYFVCVCVFVTSGQTLGFLKIYHFFPVCSFLLTNKNRISCFLAPRDASSDGCWREKNLK